MTQTIDVFVCLDPQDADQRKGLSLIESGSKHRFFSGGNSYISHRRTADSAYSPDDPRSKSLREEILKKLEKADKMVVLIGRETVEDEWVDWQVRTFHAIKSESPGDPTWKRIRGIRLKDCERAPIPPALIHRATQSLNWDLEGLMKWLAAPLD